MLFLHGMVVCRSYAEKFPDPSNHPVTVTLFAVLYSFVFVISLAGNLGVIYATVRHRSLQTVQNIFIVNLAVSDVILCMLSIPLTPITHIAKQWYFGSMLCRVVGGIQAIGLFIGTFSLCAIAIDRYFRLVVAPGSPLRKVNAIRITVLLWIISILVTLPYVYHMKMKKYPAINVCGEFCTEKWPNVHSKRIYTLFVLAIQFVIPFTIMTICYQAVFSFLRRRAQSRLTSIAQQANLLYVVAATAGGDTQQHKEQLTHLIEQKKRVMQQRRRVTLILVSMVVIFGITSLPHNIVSTLMEFTDSQDLLAYNGNDYTYLLNLITHFLAMLSCVANPLLYAFLNPEFRELILAGVAGFKWAPKFVSRTWQPTQTTCCATKAPQSVLIAI
ncbi:unnamed protein product [Cylicocyclus nassatus]|uniref:G-protein coupled receptors family 1 profile domain-containing protein n=1 Tax=Cylicocyclus nassatus TaxID=53992 RepID=A0AA36GLS7_CYLNA|nr:unnamed protein product [Cylicocyclus nassatus]